MLAWCISSKYEVVLPEHRIHYPASVVQDGCSIWQWIELLHQRDGLVRACAEALSTSSADLAASYGLAHY